MRILDDKGRVFSIIIIIALLAALVVGGISALASSGPDPEPDTQQVAITVESVDRQFVASALFRVKGCDSATVVDVVVRDRFERENESATYQRVHVRARVPSTASDGGWVYHGQELYVGNEIVVDFCDVRIDGTVVDVHGVRGESDE